MSDRNRELDWKTTDVVYVHLENGVSGYAAVEDIRAIQAAREEFRKLKEDRDHLEVCYLDKAAPPAADNEQLLDDYNHLSRLCGRQGIRMMDYETDIAAMREALEECRFALEPYDDIKPRDWSTDKERLRRTHQSVKAILAAREVPSET